MIKPVRPAIGSVLLHTRVLAEQFHKWAMKLPETTKVCLLIIIVLLFINAKPTVITEGKVTNKEVESKLASKKENFIGINIPIGLFTKPAIKTSKEKHLEIRKRAYELLLERWNPENRTFKKKGKGKKFDKQNSTITITKTDMLKYAPDFIVEEILYNVKSLASITAAQTDIESNWFSSNLAVKSNNGYGIKYVKMWDKNPDKWMGQYREGHVVAHDDTPTDKFIKFDSKWACIRFHTKFLTELHYKKHIGKDFNGWAYGLKSSGYATDKKYPKTLQDRYKRLNLIVIDQIAAQLRKEFN